MKPIDPEFHLASLDDLDAVPPSCDWLWQGFLAPGCVTLLTSPWKAGKTTLVSALLTRLGSGGTLAGLAVRAGKAVVVSEESIEQWRLRRQKFGFGPHLHWLCRPFRGRPRLTGWLALLDHLFDLRQQAGLDLVVIDPLASFLPARSESEATGVLEALAPLEKLTAAGLAVLLLHHPRKHGGPDGQWARGSGVLTAQADILLEIAYYSSATDPDRRRKLMAWSRFEATPRNLVIELDEAGTDYRSLGSLAASTFAEGWHLVQQVLDRATDKLTRREIAEQWPDGQPRPNDVTLWRWLDEAAAQGLVCKNGTGHRHDPFRYWTRSLEDRSDDIMNQLRREVEDAQRRVEEILKTPK